MPEGAGLLVVEHRAEVAHVEPGLQGSETEPEQPDGLGSHGLAKAKALIVRHRAAVLDIANARMIHRTLDAVMIHEIIALAPERARRVEFLNSVRAA